MIFVTLEDETGYINVVVWRDLAERQRRELLGARLLGVEGVLEREGEVVHLMARRLIDHSRIARPPEHRFAGFSLTAGRCFATPAGLSSRQSSLSQR